MNDLKTISIATAKVDAVELAVKKLPQIKLPVYHGFFRGKYARRMSIPRGVILVGKIHRLGHPFVLSKGKISVWTEEDGVKTICAPFKGYSSAGARRIGYAHEDCVWTTYHDCGAETDVDKLEDSLTVKHEAIADEKEVNSLFQLLNHVKQLNEVN